MSIGKKLFHQNGVLHVKELIPKDLSHFLTHIMLRYSSVVGKISSNADVQVPGCLAYIDHDIIFETVHEMIWPEIEQVIGIELIPTYAYARLYQNGNVLEKHKDRDECEISVTLQLGRSHHYSWPIWMEGSRHDLAECDAVIYRGNKLEHWRDECEGPNGYYSGQVFFHFVDANGEFTHLAGDSTIRKVKKDHYVKNRNFLMVNK